MSSNSLSENHENYLRPPTVPTPDRGTEISHSQTKHSSADTEDKGNSNDTHPKKEEMEDPTGNAKHDTEKFQTSVRPNSPSVIDCTECDEVHSVQSTITGDVSLTPANLHTPLYSTMTAMTPATSESNQAKNSIKIQNYVSTVNLGCELKLLEIYCKIQCSEYNPARFEGVVMKILDPRATALVFRTGKIVCTGTKTEHNSYLAARKFARIITKLGYPTRFLDFKIQNICATADLQFPIRLESLQMAHDQFASYEPELFPGLVYRMEQPKVVLFIFVNCKVVFTGGKSRSEINEAMDIIYPILRSFRILS